MPNNTERSRLRRKLKREGKAQFTIALELDGLRDLLLASRLVGEWDLEDHEAVRCGLEKLNATLIAERHRDF
jgi:hypothetical protein